MIHGSDGICQPRVVLQNHFTKHECRKYHIEERKMYQALVSYHIPTALKPEEGGASRLMTSNAESYSVKLSLQD